MAGYGAFEITIDHVFISRIMPTFQKRKTNRGQSIKKTLNDALSNLKKILSLRDATDCYGIPKSTLY